MAFPIKTYADIYDQTYGEPEDGNRGHFGHLIIRDSNTAFRDFLLIGVNADETDYLEFGIRLDANQGKQIIFAIQSWLARIGESEFGMPAEQAPARGAGAEKSETVADVVEFIRRCLRTIDFELTREINNEKPRMSAEALLRPVLNAQAALARLEAAAKREREASEADALAVGGVVEAARHKSVGNAAAMREALNDVISIADREFNAFRETAAIKEIRDKCCAALASPPRNCDVGTAEEQSRRFDEFCKAHSCNECPARGGWRTVYIDGTSFKMIQCGVKWAQTYEEEGKTK